MERLSRLEPEYQNAKNHIYGLAHNVCVNGLEQHALLNALAEVEREALEDGVSGKVIIKNLLATILDGLQYGNWPWIKNGINTLETGR